MGDIVYAMHYQLSLAFVVVAAIIDYEFLFCACAHGVKQKVFLFDAAFVKSIFSHNLRSATVIEYLCHVFLFFCF